MKTKLCVLCQSRTKTIHHPKWGTYYCCPSCEFISKDDEHLLSKDEEHSQYNLHNNSIDDPGYVVFFYRFLDQAVFPFADGGKEGLDFGSGPSPVLATLLERNHDYQMDIYDLYYAPEKVYEGKTYDLITSTEVVEHLREPLPYFELFSDLMKENSMLAVMTLFHPNDEELFWDWHYMRDPTHISFYKPRTMEYIASQAGLEVIYSNDERYTTFKKRGE